MKSKLTLNQKFGGAITVIALSVLAACGGGGSAADSTQPAGNTPVTPTETIASFSGTITGFGSVIVDGVKYDDTKVAVTNDKNPAAPTTGTLTDLKLGMRVDGTLKNGVMTDLVVHASLVGPVAAPNTTTSSFTVFGQTVSVVTTGATPTAFEGVADLAGLAAGDVVEVHGTLDANKVIIATRVERKPQTDLADGVRLGGLVANLDATAKTFKFNDLTIDYSAATFAPAGSTPVNGNMAVVYSDAQPVGGVLKAKAIKLDKPADGATFNIGGRIMDFTSAASFKVAGITVDASTAAFEGGAVGDLAAGVSIGIEGVVQGQVLKANKVRIFKAPVDVKASLSGQVSDWLSATNFKVRGQSVDASAATFVGGVSTDLGAGAWVLVSGKVQGDVLKADTVEFKAPPAAKPVTLKGEIRDFDAVNATFKFLGATLKLNSSTQFVGGSTANLANGKRVEATGTPGADGVVVVTKLEFLPDLTTPAPAVVGGRLSDLTDTGFKLPGMSVTFNANTVFDGGTKADLASGVMVMVKGAFNASTKTVAATWIEVIKVDANVPRVAGTVSEFTSSANFRVGGQKVDASNATFQDGVAADLKVGVLVEASGNIVKVGDDKVLVATKLRVLNK